MHFTNESNELSLVSHFIISPINVSSADESVWFQINIFDLFGSSKTSDNKPMRPFRHAGKLPLSNKFSNRLVPKRLVSITTTHTYTSCNNLYLLCIYSAPSSMSLPLCSIAFRVYRSLREFRRRFKVVLIAPRTRFPIF